MQIEIQGIHKTFHTEERTVCAVRDASLVFPEGKTVGVLGASGSGKSTLGQIVAGLQCPDAGTIRVDGQVAAYPYRGRLRQKIQILFQHPEVSFNPRLTLLQSLREPYLLRRLPFDRSELRSRLERFGLYEEHLDRYPHELSGGELQRAALTRILVLEPDFIVLDEPTSMLDSISQAQIIRMLRELQRQQRLTYLFITHNAALAERCCDEVYHMTDGKPLRTAGKGGAVW